MTRLRKWISTLLLATTALSVLAQQKADTTYTFRFVRVNDMFFVLWKNNEPELTRLMQCVESNKTEILGGRMPLHVDGYCNSLDSENENLAVAKIRSNRVKSELILRNGLKEECFVTRNHAAEGDFVTVRLTVPAERAAAVDNRRADTDAGADKAEAVDDRQADTDTGAERTEAEDNRHADTDAGADKTVAVDNRHADTDAGADKAAAEDNRHADTEAGTERAGASKTDCTTGWYAGLQGGVPFGVSQFSSFGADKTRAGWSVGIHGGYRFSPVLSVEARAAWGQVNLSARDCCPDYWIGSDAVRYETAVAGMTGWNYSALRSRTCTQSYGVQLNVNLLGFFRATRDSRWTLELAPRLAATGTKASLRTINGGDEVMKGGTRWHFGAGGNLQAAYRVADCLNLGVYTGVTCLTGNPLDGMPEHLHKSNYTWESGIRLSWLFRNTRKETEK